MSRIVQATGILKAKIGKRGRWPAVFWVILACACVVSPALATDHSGTIASNETWEPGGNPHRVTGSVTVDQGVTLRMLPGTIVQLQSSTMITVNGTLKAIGTAGQSVLFTSYRDVQGGTPAAGDWRSVQFNASSTADSLVHCEFRYGGYYYYNHYVPTVDVYGCSPVFLNCSVHNCANAGFGFHNGAHAILRDCLIYDNGAQAIWMDVSSVPAWEGDYGISFIHGNTYNGIYVQGANINANTHWHSMGFDPLNPHFGIPFFVGDSDLTVTSGVTLRLDPGVVLKFLPNFSLIVNGNGSLRALGTASRGVLFTSYRDVQGGTPAAGDWRQISFATNSVADSLVYCEFRYGGYYYYNHYVPTVDVYGCSPVFLNCSVHNCANVGIAFHNGAHALLRDCQIYDNGAQAIWTDVSSVPTWEGDYGISYIHGNTYNGIYVSGAAISANTHWHSMGFDPLNPQFGIPFFVGDSHLTVTSGVT